MPSLGNYYVFINQVYSIRDNSTFFVNRLVGGINTGAEGYVTAFQGSLGGNAASDYFDYGVYIPPADQIDLLDFHYQFRLLLPNDTFSYQGNTNSLLGIKYTEVYFGGQSNY